MLNPPLTTVNQPFEEIGNAVFDIAINSIEGKLTEEIHTVIDPGLIIRASA